MPDAVKCPTVWWPFSQSPCIVLLVHPLFFLSSFVRWTRTSCQLSISCGMVPYGSRTSPLLTVMLLCGIVYGDIAHHVVSVNPKSRLVYLRDCPIEVPDSSYGVVHSVSRSYHDGFPGLFDGNRVVKMTLTQDVPSSVHVSGYDCRVWYRCQPAFCSVCKKSGHRGKACPLNGLCRRCRQAGHVARECRNAWVPVVLAVTLLRLQMLQPLVQLLPPRMLMLPAMILRMRYLTKRCVPETRRFSLLLWLRLLLLRWLLLILLPLRLPVPATAVVAVPRGIVVLYCRLPSAC